jgi:hypothetical protein
LREKVELAPGSLEKLDADPQFHAMLLRRLERDAERATPMGSVRADIQRAREIIAKDGLRGLFEAMRLSDDEAPYELVAFARVRGGALPDQ